MVFSFLLINVVKQNDNAMELIRTYFEIVHKHNLYTVKWETIGREIMYTHRKQSVVININGMDEQYMGEYWLNPNKTNSINLIKKLLK